jgi:hypothetical protein
MNQPGDFLHMYHNGSILREVLDLLGKHLTPESAKALVDFKLDSATEARLDELADKNTEGTLTPEERQEYEVQVDAIGIVSILQAKARRLLKTSA